jgi:hypothetical protein
VARGHHDAAVELLGRGREVHALGAAEADVRDVDAAVRQAAHQRAGKLRAREADVAPDRHGARLDEARVGLADLVGEIVVDLVGDAAADIVGLEAAEVHLVCPSLP